MKALLFLAPIVCSASAASAQTSQVPVFYPPTERVVLSEVTPQGKREVIERRTIILLGFLPRTQGGKVQEQTRPITGEMRDYRLEAHVKSHDFDRTFARLKADVLKAKFTNFQPKLWKFSTPVKNSGISGWSNLPSTTLNANERLGSMVSYDYVQRFYIEGSRNSKDPYFNISGKGTALHYKASISSYTEGPYARPLEKGRAYDFQTLPTQEQMEELYAHRFGG